MRKIDQRKLLFWGRTFFIYIVPSYNIKVFECFQDLIVGKAYK